MKVCNYSEEDNKITYLERTNQCMHVSTQRKMKVHIYIKTKHVPTLQRQ
jgi:hypothetical protein